MYVWNFNPSILLVLSADFSHAALLHQTDCFAWRPVSWCEVKLHTYAYNICLSNPTLPHFTRSVTWSVTWSVAA
ncbi:hypothetical protein F5051DRAFT_403752 [Lentinula edodes]|nr:hypothetical protein F5051DRAFT_403752 [Lentinula edodes]